MRAIKSGSDKSAFERFDTALSAHCTDMSIYLQAAAYQDEHALLRDIVQRVGGIQAIQSNPDLEEKLDQLTLAQVLHPAPSTLHPQPYTLNRRP